MQSDTAEKSIRLDKKFISPFLHGVKKVCNDMAGVDPLAQEPKPIRTKFPVGDAANVMPMKTPEMSGQLCLSYTKGGLLELAQRLLGEELTEIDDVALDVGGEITNMVTGVAKAQLESIGYDFDMSRPEPFFGQSLTELELLGNPRIVVPYELSSGKIFVDLGFIPR